MAKQNTGTEIPSERFSWHPDTWSFSAELSDLAAHHAPLTQGSLFQRVYPDACDVGFPMRSATTGKTAWFVFTHADETAPQTEDAEIHGWNFEPSVEAVRANPNLAGVTVLVVND